MNDVNLVLWKYGWYMAEVVCLIDEAGQARDVFIAESKPAEWQEARDLSRLAIRDWPGRNDPDAWQAAASASALVGDFKNALEQQKKAITVATSAGWALEPLNARLEAYESSRTVTDEVVMIPSVARVVVTGEPSRERP